MNFTGETTCISCGKKMEGGGCQITPNWGITNRQCPCGVKAFFYDHAEYLTLEASFVHKDRYEKDKEEINKLLAVFSLADIAILNHWLIKNEYSGTGNNWLLVKTKFGLIKIGWRKRVINIDWSDTGVSYLVEDDVTKDNLYCHAWGYSEAVKYLTKLNDVLERNFKNEKKI